ncbi:MAG: hypothetical protein KC620_17255, partial [Myxococcales bacterium]|nr:hypothetical protein [Myxococcales bacterium]
EPHPALHRRRRARQQAEDRARGDALAAAALADELDRLEAPRLKLEGRVRRLLGDLPPGSSAILVTDDRTFVEGAPEVTERLPVIYAPEALHGYLDRRLPVADDLPDAAAAEARLDQSILRYALLHAAQMRPEAIDRMLADRQIGATAIDDQPPRAVFQWRLRAAQQIALEIVLAERTAVRAADPRFARLLTASLLLPLRQWAHGEELDLSEVTLSAHLDRAEARGAWASASAAERARVWSALKTLLDLLSNRAGLVDRLPPDVAPLASLIPDASMLVRDGKRWIWTFDAEGLPIDMRLAEADAGPISEAPSDRRDRSPLLDPPRGKDGGRFRALGDETFEAPRRLHPGDPLPMTGEFRAWKAGPDGAPTEGSMDDAHSVADGSLGDGGRSEERGPRTLAEIVPRVPAADAARFLEAVDEALGPVVDGALSVARLGAAGLLPTIPAGPSVTRAIADGASPAAQIVLAEAVGRVREHLGVIEKFVFWLAAARALAGPRTSTTELAVLLVRARGLRGRGTAEQHARLALRTLQAELRVLCPRARVPGTLFRRTAAPGTDADALVKWGQNLAQRAGELTRLLRDGSPPDVLTEAAWRALRTRLRLLVVDGDAGLPGFVEVIAAVHTVAGARITDWLTQAPTTRQLSALLLSAHQFMDSEQLGEGGLFAALALGLNRNGVEAAGLPLPARDSSEAGDLIRNAGRARGPVALILTNDDAHGRLARSAPPRRGSALVLTPDEVATHTKRLGFEVIFLDDPTIDAGMLPLPPAPVVTPPLADDIDAALDWWTTHR